MRYVRSYPTELPVLRDLMPEIEAPVQIIAGKRDPAVAPVNADFLHRGTASWSWAITEAAAKLRGELDGAPRPVTATADTTDLVFNLPPMERHAYSAIFAEVAVDPATGEVRVRRLLGMFGIGRVINPLMARSQAIGGMIMGLSTALHEESVRDPVSGRHINADLAGYHIAAHADIPDVEATSCPITNPATPRASRESVRSAPSAPRRRSPTPSGTRRGPVSGRFRSASTGS